MTMPLRPGTGIPYGISPFAFSAGAGEAGSTVRVNFSSLAGFGGAPGALGPASPAFDSWEAGCREARVVFLGWGWKAFEIDWPTFLKKSPTGSAFAHCPLKKKSAATGKQTRRERMRRFTILSAFNLKPGFSARIGG